MVNVLPAQRALFSNTVILLGTQRTLLRLIALLLASSSPFADLPTLLYSLFWKRLTNRGAVRLIHLPGPPQGRY
ncbi:hypothetical protein ACFVW8_12325 [Streptomyces sp. NPDC058221]|uniref:hypothetical protein n=1 Tax=Streptomyces sp. NPDC058221 TaxID=3346388 RepID=UPI0036E2C402